MLIWAGTPEHSEGDISQVKVGDGEGLMLFESLLSVEVFCDKPIPSPMAKVIAKKTIIAPITIFI